MHLSKCMPNCSHAHPSPAFCMAGNFAIPVELRQTAPCVNESLTPNCVYCLRAVSWNWSYQAKGCVQGLRSFTPAAGLPSRKNVTVMWPPERLCLQSAWQGFQKPTSLVEFALLPSSVNLNTFPPHCLEHFHVYFCLFVAFARVVSRVGALS